MEGFLCEVHSMSVSTLTICDQTTILTLEMGRQKLTLNGFGVFFDPKVPFAPVHTGR